MKIMNKISFYCFLLLLVVIMTRCKANDFNGNDTTNYKINPDSIQNIFNSFSLLGTVSDDLKLNLKNEVKGSYDGDEYTIYYYLDTLNYTFRKEFSFVGTQIKEARILLSENSIKILYSENSGTSSFTSQNEIKVFEYNPLNKTFDIDTINTGLFQIKFKDYFKANTPDSIISDLSNNSNFFFNIVLNKTGIAENEIFSTLIGENLIENKWLKGNKITYKYKDNKIMKSNPYFENE